MKHEVRILFHELADLPPPERDRIFRDRGIAAELRAEVESLIGFDSANSRQLADRVAYAADELLRTAGGGEQSRCGPYRLVRLLGSGGMGSVYLAERTDGEIQQKVAVKLLGIHSHRAVSRDRFLQERQLLASLHHPSIVHVIDAGHTGTGRPYLVMEYVDGLPIDLYAAKIALHDRLRLFLRVCDAVSHAHHHLIIHRDLKPSNILVDASGQPKLLDFGIAKLLDDTADVTQTVDRLLTPNYASPEQLQGQHQTIATDVYSLGAVLSTLVAGRSPHEPPNANNPDLPADLGYILRKALRDEPEERYASVESFAADVLAFLESRPVEARSGNAWYRTRKFARRYWVPVAAAALVIASLATGLYVANRQRILAERRFDQLQQLSHKVFELDRDIQNLPGSTAARQRLISASLEYLEGLASSAYGDLDLAQEMADGYERVAKVQGVPTNLNLGQFDKAESSLKKADAFIEIVLTSRPQSRQALLTASNISHDRMILAQSEHRRQDALAYARKSSDRVEALLRLEGLSDSERADATKTYANIALAYLNMHLYSEGIRYAKRSVDLSRSLSPRARYGLSLSTGLSLLANALRYQGDLEGALSTIQEARSIAEKSVYTNDTVRMIDLYGILYREGLILGEERGINLNRPEDAIEPLQQAFDLTESAARKDANDYTSRSREATCGTHLANILRDRDPQRALAIYDLVIRRLNEIHSNLAARRQLASALANSTYALLALHQPALAKQRIDQAFAILKDTKDYPAQQISLNSAPEDAYSALAGYQAQHDDPLYAIQIDLELLDKVLAAHPDPVNDLQDAPHISLLYQALAELYRRTGDFAKEQDMAARRRALWDAWDHKLPNNSFIHRQLEAARRP